MKSLSQVYDNKWLMRHLYHLLLCLMGLNIIAIDVHAEKQITADSIAASSSDFLDVQATVDLDPSTYAYLSASVGVLSSSYITFCFPQSGHAGDLIAIDMEASGGLLGTSLLDHVTLRIYDESDVNVATASGASLLSLNLSLGADQRYTLRYMTDILGSYTIKKVKLEFNNVLSVQLLNELRLYNAHVQPPCTPVMASSVQSFSNNLLTGYVTSPNASVSEDDDDFSTLHVLVAVPPLTNTASLNLNFATTGTAGEYVGFTVGEASTLLSLAVLQSLKIEALNASGTVVASKNNFALADLRLLTGSSDKYNLGFITPAGSYTIARLKITMNGVSVLNSLKVYNAMHFKLAPAAVSILSSASEFCSGSSLQLTASVPSNTSIQWNSGETSANITVDHGGTYSFVATDNEGCASASGLLVIIENPLPVVSISAPHVSFCEGELLALQANAPANTDLHWSNGKTSDTIMVYTPGTYTLTATATATGCVSQTAQFSVSMMTSPTVSIANGSQAAVCSNAELELTAVASPGATVLWNTGASTTTLNVHTGGTYSITATALNGCHSQTDSIQVTALTAPQVDITAGASTSFCSNAQVQLTCIATSGTTMLWSNGAIGASILVNAAGYYTVIASDAQGCSDTSGISVARVQAPQLNGTANDVSCQGNNDGSIQLTPSDMSAAYTYAWSNAASTTFLQGLAPGMYTVDVTDTHTACVVHLEYMIHEPEVLTLSGASYNETCLGHDGRIELIVEGGTAPYAYSLPDVHHEVLSGLTAATYTIAVTDKNNCQASDSFVIAKANCNIGLNIYNVVTPNNDGLNEVFFIEGIENYPNNTLEIYNKWGDRVYNGEHYNNNWSGRNRDDAAELPHGTYYFILKLNAPHVPNGQNDYTGYLMIL